MKCVSFENEITRNTLHYATVTDVRVIYKVFQNNMVQKDTRIYRTLEILTDDSKGSDHMRK
jgi:hypothetical protein